MTAGPTPVPPAVSQAIAQPMLYHRAPAFQELFSRVLERLRTVFQTGNDVLVFAASGTGAMESAAANLISPGTQVLTCAAGKFGERWVELCDQHQADQVRYEAAWGERLDVEAISDRLGENPKIDIVFATLSETSTGIVHDIEAIARVVREHDAIFVVDAISGLGATDLRQDEWGVDVVIGGSQKALMCPPGLAFASVSERALKYAAANGSARYYFDWARTAKAQRKSSPQSAFTPAVGLLAGLDVALTMIEDEGFDDVLERHRILARATRSGVEALGLELFGDPDDRSTVVTAVALPDAIDGADVPKLMRSIGVTANGGQEHLKGKILRIAHCGYFGAFDILISLSALESSLLTLGHEFKLGAGISAAQSSLLKSGRLELVGR